LVERNQAFTELRFPKAKMGQSGDSIEAQASSGL
jgi:hypothetical protein